MVRDGLCWGCMENMVKAKDFWCSEDSKHWATDDYCVHKQLPAEVAEQVEDLGEESPYNSFAKCPVCKTWCRSVPHYYANLEKMRANATGPKTEDGKRRSSVNGITHGIYAQPHHMIAPANGKYDICEDCDIKERCEAKELRYCPYKQDLMVRFMAAVENGDSGALRQYAGLSQGRLYIVLENMFQEVMKLGPAIKQPRLNAGKVVTIENEQGEETTLYEYVEHPLLDDIPKIMQALGMTSDQQNMNPSKAEETDREQGGNLKAPEDPVSFIKNMTELVNAIKNGSAPEIAKLKRESDPVYQELNKDGEESSEVEIDESEENPFKRGR